jgi:hypothetical protein
MFQERPTERRWGEEPEKRMAEPKGGGYFFQKKTDRVKEGNYRR